MQNPVRCFLLLHVSLSVFVGKPLVNVILELGFP